jgi:nitrite reductase/ring-hydroxylating ferredoxin subunit
MSEGWVRAGTLDEIRTRGVVVVGAGGHSVAVFPDGDGAAAVDNRCPHMGFPLSRGTVCDGILTCHWHHARFDLATGGTFDPFADDVRSTRFGSRTASSGWTLGRGRSASGLSGSWPGSRMAWSRTCRS